MTDETRITSPTGGQKGAKTERHDLIPVGPIRQVATVYGLGAQKYAARNWEQGYDWSLNYAAAQRHMTAFWGGEDLDPELGTPHLAHAAFHMLALLEFMETHREYDDRATTVTAARQAPYKVAVGPGWTPGDSDTTGEPLPPFDPATTLICTLLGDIRPLVSAAERLNSRDRK
jgi:hypothetical protein